MNTQNKEINLGVISYRLDEMEKNFEKNMEKILNKIDDLIEKHSASEIAQRELSVKVNNLEEEVKDLKAAKKKVEDDLSAVKVSIAEKMGYGVLGGGVVTLISKLFLGG